MLFRAILVALTLLQAFLIGLFRFHNPDERWKAKRSFAMKMLRIIWTFRTYSGPFDESKLPQGVHADDILEMKLEEWRNNLLGTGDLVLTNIFQKANQNTFRHGQYDVLCEKVSTMKDGLIVNQIASVLSKEPARPCNLTHDMTFEGNSSFQDVDDVQVDDDDVSCLTTICRCCCLYRRLKPVTVSEWHAQAEDADWSDNSVYSRSSLVSDCNDDQFSPITANVYAENRAKTALRFYQGRVPSYSFQRDFFMYAISLFTVISSACAVFNFSKKTPPEFWVAIITAIITCFGSFEGQYEPTNKLRRYNNTIGELKRILFFWEGLTLLEQNKLQNITYVVEYTERAILDVSI